MMDIFYVRALITGLIVFFNMQYSNAQNIKDTMVNIDFTIRVDSNIIEDQGHFIQVKDLTTGKDFSIYGFASLVLNFEYCKLYTVTVSRHNTNKKTIYVETDAPRSEWYIISGFNLTVKDTASIIAGSIRYDTQLNKFIKSTDINFKK